MQPLLTVIRCLMRGGQNAWQHTARGQAVSDASWRCQWAYQVLCLQGTGSAHLQALEVPAGVAAVAQQDAVALIPATAGVAHHVLLHRHAVRSLGPRAPDRIPIPRFIRPQSFWPIVLQAIPCPSAAQCAPLLRRLDMPGICASDNPKAPPVWNLSQALDGAPAEVQYQAFYTLITSYRYAKHKRASGDHLGLALGWSVHCSAWLPSSSESSSTSRTCLFWRLAPGPGDVATSAASPASQHAQ